MDCWLRETSVIEVLLFRKHGRVTILEVDVLPAKSLVSLVASITEYLRTSYTGIREEIYQSPVAAGLDRRPSVLTDVVDRGTRLLVDEPGELLAILDGPRLLVTTLVTAVVGDGFGRVATLCDVLSEVALTDGPATER
jgi:hypothetical protein